MRRLAAGGLAATLALALATAAGVDASAIAASAFANGLITASACHIAPLIAAPAPLVAIIARLITGSSRLTALPLLISTVAALARHSVAAGSQTRRRPIATHSLARTRLLCLRTQRLWV